MERADESRLGVARKVIAAMGKDVKDWVKRALAWWSKVTRAEQTYKVFAAEVEADGNARLFRFLVSVLPNEVVIMTHHPPIHSFISTTNPAAP